MTLVESDEPVESTEAFEDRVRSFAKEHLTPLGGVGGADDKVGEQMRAEGLDPLDPIRRGRFMLRLLADAGLGGISFPAAAWRDLGALASRRATCGCVQRRRGGATTCSRWASSPSRSA